MISFIVPAYNASDYLERAVSGFAQTTDLMQQIEVLIVENGSTDNTPILAEKLAKKYPYVRVLHSDKGVSNARNLGLQEAQGEWIAFIDADDYLKEDALQILLEDANNADAYDLYVYGHWAGERSNIVTAHANKEVFVKEQVEAARIRMIENPTRYMQVWAKLFRSDLIKKYQLTFEPKLRLSEDSDFTLRYGKYCTSICFSPNVVYHYSIDNASTMRTYNEDKINDYLFAMRHTKQNVQAESNRIQKAFYKYVLMHLNIAMVRDVFSVANQSRYSKKIARMKQIIQEDIFHEAIVQTNIMECKSLRMLPILCMKWHFYWISGFVYKVRANSNHAKEH